MTMTLKGQLEDAAEKRDRLMAEAKEILATATDGELSNEQAAKLDELTAEAERTQAFLKAHRSVERMNKPTFGMDGQPGTLSSSLPQPDNGSLARGLVNLSTNERIPVWSGGKPMAGRENDLRVGETLFGWLRGDHSPRMEQVGGVDSSGGFIINPSGAPFIVDAARARSVVSRLGAMYMEMDSPEVRIGTVSGDPSASWVGELGAVTASDVTFGLKTLRARKMVTLLTVSDEWLMDASNGAALLEGIIAQAMAAELDRVVLRGAGSANEPLGILNDSDRESITSIGAISDFADPVNAVATIYGNNYAGEPSGLGWVNHPTIRGDYELLVDGNNQPLIAPAWVQQLRDEVTTNLQTSTSLVGDFSQVLIGTRMSGMRFEILDSGSVTQSDSDSVNAVTQVARHVRMYWYGDTVVLRPNWFVSLEGITT